jgi:2-methylfumaryl-CoA isomerase
MTSSSVIAALQDVLGADFADESDRYVHRETIAAIMRPWFARQTIDRVGGALTDAGVLWSRYRAMSDVVADFEAGRSSGVLTEVDQPGIGQVISARSPLRDGANYGPSAAAPTLGQNTDEVLVEVLGLGDAELGRLHDAGIVAGSGPAPVGEAAATAQTTDTDKCSNPQWAQSNSEPN